MNALAQPNARLQVLNKRYQRFYENMIISNPAKRLFLRVIHPHFKALYDSGVHQIATADSGVTLQVDSKLVLELIRYKLILDKELAKFRSYESAFPLKSAMNGCLIDLDRASKRFIRLGAIDKEVIVPLSSLRANPYHLIDLANLIYLANSYVHTNKKPSFSKSSPSDVSMLCLRISRNIQGGGHDPVSVLIDADLMIPIIKNLFNVSSSSGISILIMKDGKKTEYTHGWHAIGGNTIEIGFGSLDTESNAYLVSKFICEQILKVSINEKGITLPIVEDLRDHAALEKMSHAC